MRRFILSATALLVACSMEPPYQRPEMATPATWRTTADESSTLANARWWEAFEDPVLNALIKTAIEQNQDFQIAVWRVSEYFSQYKIVRAQQFPQIQLNATGVKEHAPTSFQNTLPGGVTLNSSNFSFDATLSYELDFWGALRSGTRAAYAQMLSQVENRRIVLLTLISNVAQSYVVLRQLDLQLEVAQKSAASFKESLELTRYQYEGGIVSEMDVEQALSAYEEARLTVKNLEQQIAQQENLISVLLGQNPSAIQRGKSIDQLLLPVAIPAGLPSELLERRPDIMQAENLLIAANAQIGVARANFFPNISLTGLYGGESNQLKNLFSSSTNFWEIGGQLIQSIFSGGQLTGQLHQAEAQYQELLYTYQKTVLNAFREVEDALVAHSIAKDLIEIQKKRLTALEEYLQLAELQYNQGETDYLSVLNAQRQLLSAQLDCAQTQANLFTTLVTLYKALGGGWVQAADPSGPPGFKPTLIGVPPQAPPKEA